jgi:TRAP-type C4-dicarboxylate transport system permease small subunit
MQLPDSLRRALRTFVQAFVGTLAVLAIPALTDIMRAAANAEPYEIDFRFWQSAVIAACASGVIALISFIQNYLEDSTNFPAVGKAPASPGQNPTPDPTPDPPPTLVV